MSTERVVEFFHTVAGDPKLNQQMRDVAKTPEGWLLAASHAGFDLRTEDLRMVAEEIVQKPFSEENFVPELAQSLFDDNGPYFSPDAMRRLKAVMQQGRYSGYYRPW